MKNLTSTGKLTKEYKEYLEKVSFIDRSENFITDKAPLNFRWIGLKNKVSEDLLQLIQNEESLLSQGTVIKNEEGHLVVHINLSGSSLFVKKYRIKKYIRLVN